MTGPTDHPLGADDQAPTNGTATAKSIVDEVLNLSDFMAGDVRRAEKTIVFYSRADLEARLDELDVELAGLTDAQGRPRAVTDRAVGDSARSADAVVVEREKVAEEMNASAVHMRVKQMDEDDWAALLAKHKKTLDDPPPYTPAFYEELIIGSQLRFVGATTGKLGDPLTLTEFREFRKKIGRPVFDRIFGAAWAVNTASGVSIPKSLISSVVQSQQQRG